MARFAVVLWLICACFPALSEAARICDDCMSNNDTTSSPGKTATGRWIRDRTIAPPVAFVGADGLLRCAVPAPPGWQIESVDPVALAGGCSMDLAATLEPIIGYHDANGLLLGARRTAFGWEREAIDPISRVLGGTSIASIPGGIGIAYVDAQSRLLLYGEQNAAGTWMIEIAAQAGAPEAYPSLIVDGTIRAISYYDAVGGDLRLAQRGAGGSWSTSLVDSAGDVGGYTSLVGGPSLGGFGIAYYDFTHADLRYAHGAPGGWTIETVDSTGAAGQFCSAVAFAGTPEDEVGIGYYDRTNGDLKYALKHGPAWTTTVLDTSGDTGGSVSCGGTLAPNDTIGIAYVDRIAGHLNYLYRTSALTAVPVTGATPAALRVQWLSTPGDAGGRIRFTVPAPGNVRVALYDTQGRLVAVPLREALPAGPTESRWDGRDENGALVGAGVFFVRVQTTRGAGSAVAILLR